MYPYFPANTLTENFTNPAALKKTFFATIEETIESANASTNENSYCTACTAPNVVAIIAASWPAHYFAFMAAVSATFTTAHQTTFQNSVHPTTSHALKSANKTTFTSSNCATNLHSIATAFLSTVTLSYTATN